MLKPNIEFEDELDLEEKADGIHSVWFQADGSLDNPVRKEEMNNALTSDVAIRLFNALGAMLSKRFVARSRHTWSFSSPNFKEEMIYTEGYKTALRDIYKLIPKS